MIILGKYLLVLDEQQEVQAMVNISPVEWIDTNFREEIVYFPMLNKIECLPLDICSIGVYTFKERISLDICLSE